MSPQTLSAAPALDELRRWIRRSERAEDVITPRLEASFRATFNRPPGSPALGEEASLCLHWCLAPAIAPTDALGDDGHPRRGGFLPPIPLPRRMWAGGELLFHAPLRVGDAVTRVSEIADVSSKRGRSGELCFVTVRHIWSTPRGVAVEERQDIVYRSAEPAGVAPPIQRGAEAEAMWRRSWPCDPVLLFRYSALSFNGHRIHFDQPYVTEIENYPGLVVHAPLQATVLAALAAEAAGAPLRRFEFRGVAPLFANSGPFTAKAARAPGGLRLWICDSTGAPTMTGQAEW